MQVDEIRGEDVHNRHRQQEFAQINHGARLEMGQIPANRNHTLFFVPERRIALSLKRSVLVELHFVPAKPKLAASILEQ